MALSHQHYLRNAAIVLGVVVLVVWTAFPSVWIPMTSLKNSADIISAPPKFVFHPTADNYAALFLGNQQRQYSSTCPDFPSYFLNSVIISTGAVVLSVPASIPAAYALARFSFPLKNPLGFIFMSFRFVPFLAFVIPLYLLYQRVRVCTTHISG